ncbi:flavonoid 3'-monooxygenase [Selaginella moellendorffii]|uniref:flavonoid 3'-monooxygenase n=1 Tax=Selaginella moellendorffii TaxID=88036 RepID=UPI000D1C30C7|nr:flavonoid 3'-monooxygenase [Selaginella moellendorffii]|eukprot:XP_024515354.1 flavonoid 3'-monooxygenase [Selaginella moellendorffii]
MGFTALRRNNNNLPPSPGWAIPLVGHLYLVGMQAHRSLQALSQKCGPIMYLKLGLVPSIIVSSPEMAKEALKDNGLAFASRPYLLINELVGYNSVGIGIRYGEHTKRLRKICTVEFLTTQRIDSFSWVRSEELSRAFRVLLKSRERKAAVNLRELLSTFTFNAVTEILMSRRFFGDASKGDADSIKFRRSIHQSLSLAIKFHITEFVPAYLRGFLEWLDPSIPHFKKLHEIQDRFLQKVLEEHKESRQSTKDFMDIMLENFKEEGSGGENVVKAVITDLILASDSTGVAAEWAMAQLLHNPSVMEKAQIELNLVVGPNRLVEESDFSKLEYFQAIIKETMRLCPPGPLLIPRSSDEACKIGGYHIPKGSTLFINAFAMGRDPRIWEHPTKFMPERFLGSSTDIKGQHFELIPFGSGRRICPGMPLGLRTLQLILSNLLHGFDWSFVQGKVYTLEDTFETALLLKIPLEVMATPRHSLDVYKVF